MFPIQWTFPLPCITHRQNNDVSVLFVMEKAAFVFSLLFYCGTKRTSFGVMMATAVWYCLSRSTAPPGRSQKNKSRCAGLLSRRRCPCCQRVARLSSVLCFPDHHSIVLQYLGATMLRTRSPPRPSFVFLSFVYSLACLVTCVYTDQCCQISDEAASC